MTETTIPATLLNFSTRTCAKGRFFAFLGLGLCALAQFFIDQSIDNVISVSIVVFFSFSTIWLVLRASVFRRFPLPAFVVLGFSFATMSGALFFQTLDGLPLIFNLQVPLFTFAMCAGMQCTLIVTLWIFSYIPFWRTFARRVNVSVMRPLALMRLPSEGQLWMLGAIGSAVMVWSAAVARVDGIEYGDVFGKFFSGLAYLAYAPFLIPLRSIAIDPEAKNSSRLALLLSYLLGQLVIGVALNSRAAFATGVGNLAMAFALLLILGQFRLKGKALRRVLLGGVALIAFLPVLSDIAIAMVVVRAERSSISGSELVSKTVDAFQDKATLDAARQAAAIAAGGGIYEENYISNPFAARFIYTKFVDNSLSLSEVQKGRRSDALWQITADKILFLLPTPLLRFLGAELDKRNLEFSMGDVLYDLEYGFGLGGYRVGSPVGHGYALIGLGVFFVSIPVFLVSFLALQSLTAVKNGFLVFSPVILLQITRVYIIPSGDSFIDVFLLLLRTLPQQILIYFLLFHITRFLLNTLGRSSKRGFLTARNQL